MALLQRSSGPVVLGAGTLGLACAYALSCSSGVTAVRILSRQKGILDLLDAQPSPSSHQRTIRVAPHLDPIPWPQHRLVVEAFTAPSRPQASPLLVCICAPLQTAMEDGTVGDWLMRQHFTAVASSVPASADVGGDAVPSQPPSPVVLVFSRGLTSSGLTAVEVVQQRLPAGVRAIAACGPLAPLEWLSRHPHDVGDSAEEGSAADTLKLEKDKGVTPSSSRAFSGISFAIAAPSSAVPLEGVMKEGTESSTASSSICEDDVLSIIQSHFPRENILPYTYKFGSGAHQHDDTMALSNQVLGLVNGVLPLIAFGGGLVAHVYGSPPAVSATAALLSYAANAVDATTDLIQRLLLHHHSHPSPSSQATSQAPVPAAVVIPPIAVAAIYCAAQDHSSPEFQLGKHLEFHFRKEDALKATFRSTSSSGGAEREVPAKATLEDTADGMQNLLELLYESEMERKVAEGDSSDVEDACEEAVSPLFDGLLDAYVTVVRASVVGEGLVKAGYSTYRSVSSAPQLMAAVQAVDEAMINGTEEDLKAAAEALVTRFGK